MKLSCIAEEIGASYSGSDLEIESVVYDSRAVTPGCLFCCLVGLVSDGHTFAAQAAEKGAAALIVQRRLPLPFSKMLSASTRLSEGRPPPQEQPF